MLETKTVANEPSRSTFSILHVDRCLKEGIVHGIGHLHLGSATLPLQAAALTRRTLCTEQWFQHDFSSIMCRQMIATNNRGIMSKAKRRHALCTLLATDQDGGSSRHAVQASPTTTRRVLVLHCAPEIKRCRRARTCAASNTRTGSKKPTGTFLKVACQES